MAAAVSSLVPYQPIPSLPTREQIANAHDYISKAFKIQRKSEDELARAREENKTLQAAHESLKQSVASGLEKYGSFAVQEAAIATSALGLGATNGYYGGDAGIVEKWGLSIDTMAAIVGFAAGAACLFVDDKQAPKLELLTKTCVAVANTGMAATLYRFGHQHGSERARANVGGAAHDMGHAPANGAKGGTVYSVHTPPGQMTPPSR